MEHEVEIVILVPQTILTFSFVEIGAQLSHVLVWLVIGAQCPPRQLSNVLLASRESESERFVLSVHHVNWPMCY